MERLSVDAASPDAARAMLRSCCGATAWIERMMTRRPFGSADAMLAAARHIWFSLTQADWLEAFADHPKIGDRQALRQRFAETRHLASREQSGVQSASDDLLEALAAGNRAYEEKFGFIFIICATGLTATQMLEMLMERLQHPPEAEILIAADEQAKITELRLKRL